MRCDAYRAKWDKMTVAPISGRKSPGPSNKRVNFAQPQPTYRSPRFSQPTNNFGQPPMRPSYFNPRPRFVNPRMPYRPTYFPRPQQQGTQCFKCGRSAHAHPNYCPAINRLCNFCLKRGHFSSVCQAAMRTRNPSPYFSK